MSISRPLYGWLLRPRCAAVFLAIAITLLGASSADAGRSRGRRGPSPQQIQKMKEEMAYRQKEILRVQAEVSAKERELFSQFDVDGNGRLLGVERSLYDKRVEEIRTGRAPNPLADIVPLGRGPRDSKPGGGKK